jgi:hypothetical protein
MSNTPRCSRADLFALDAALGACRTQNRLIAEPDVLPGGEGRAAIQRRTLVKPPHRRRLAIAVCPQEHVRILRLFLRLVEAVGCRQGDLITTQLLDNGQPLLLVHGVAGDQEGQHVLILGLVEQTDRQKPAGGFGGDVAVHVPNQVATGVDMRHVERDAIGIGWKRRHPGRQDVPLQHPSTT